MVMLSGSIPDFLSFSLISGANAVDIDGTSLSFLVYSFPTFSLKSSNMICLQGELESLFDRGDNKTESSAKTTQNKTTNKL